MAGKAPARPDKPSTARATVTADMVRSWWPTTKRHPIPDAEACHSLAFTIEICLRHLARAPANKKSRQHPTQDALAFLSQRVPIARKYWENHTTEPLRDEALRWLTSLQALLVPWAAEFLREDMIFTQFVHWESFVRTIYPNAVATFTDAGGAAPKPHSGCPVCVFLSKALANTGFRQGSGVEISPGAVSQFLRERSGLTLPSPHARSLTYRGVHGDGAVISDD